LVLSDDGNTRSAALLTANKKRTITKVFLWKPLMQARRVRAASEAFNAFCTAPRMLILAIFSLICMALARWLPAPTRQVLVAAHAESGASSRMGMAASQSTPTTWLRALLFKHRRADEWPPVEAPNTAAPAPALPPRSAIC
jgi:hypothetical protein